MLKILNKAYKNDRKDPTKNYSSFNEISEIYEQNEYLEESFEPRKASLIDQSTSEDTK